MTDPIARRSLDKLWRGNGLLFVSAGFGLAADFFHTLTPVDGAAWLGVGLCSYGVLVSGIKGIRALVSLTHDMTAVCTM